MPTRKAIIIGNNTGYQAPNYLPGVDIDIRNYYDYLISDIGGEWYSSAEIEILHNKSRNEILSTIRKCSADYSFVVFSGHGFIYSKDGLTYICASDGYVSEDELDTRLNKQTLILDCCRGVSGLSEGLSGFRGESFAKGDPTMQGRRRVLNSRSKFDAALSISSNGIFKGYSCLVDETAGDNPTSGGILSAALIKEGIRFGSVDNHYTNWLSVKATMDRAITAISNNPFTNQTPEYYTNMNTTAPFAITNKII